MRCSTCGTENPPQAKFCLECAAPLARRCSSCGTVLPEAAKFCLECAQPVTTTVMGPAPPASPQRYTPRHLADKILAHRAGLEGERKQVTVLFADVVGSTELIRDLDPEDGQRLLDGAVTRMMDAVHRYEGTVSRVMGDGIMALFGAPIAHEDHAVRACYVALAMQDAVRRYGEEVRRTHGVEVEIRVGMNSGEVVVRLISDDLHMDYTALGPTVHLASRMEQLARASTTRLTADTLALVEGYVQVRALGPVPVKGLAEPIPAFELIGAADLRTRVQVAAARGLTRFVGREAEMAALHAALERAQTGQGQVVAMVGEPGVGKSRLVWEVTHSHRTQDWLVLESGSVSHGKATPWLPVIDLLKSYCRIEPRDDARAVREKVVGKLLALDEDLRPLWPALLALLDQPVDDPAWLALDAAQRRRRTLDGIKRLLLRESQVQPLLLIFEDLHWLDSETQALLASVVDGLPTARMVLLVNYRPEYRHDWGSKSYYTQVRVDPLAAEGVHELLSSVLGDDESLESVSAALMARTAGNPFFLEESIQTLVETGALVGDRGAYRLLRPVEAFRVPATVQAMLAARIDRLAPEDKRLLQTASVVGKDVSYGQLGEIAELPDDALRSGLARLQAAEFVYETALFPELEYTFKHALTHEVAYGSLLQDRRKALHARIVVAIEELDSDRLDEQVERLAYHAVRGEVWEKAVAYCRQAGAKGIARTAYREAVAWLEQALAALPHLPTQRETMEQGIDLRLDLRTALIPLAEHGRLLECLREAEAMAEALGDHGRLGYTLSLLPDLLFIYGDPEQAVETGRRALAVVEALGDLRLRVATNFSVGLVYVQQGDYRAAIACHRWVVETLEGELLRERPGMASYPAVSCRGNLAWCLAELGEFDEGTRHGEDAVRLAEALDHPYSLTGACNLFGGLHVRRGQPDQAIAALERGVGLCRTWEFPQQFPQVAARLGAAYTLAGRPADGIAILEQATEQAASRGLRSNASLQDAWLGDAYLAAGRIDDAIDVAGRALDLAVTRHERGPQAWVHHLAGEIAARREPGDEQGAQTHYRAALALAEELGMRPLQAHCHLGLGKLYRRTGRLDEARAELATAVAMLREMEMVFWLPEAAAALAATTESPSTEPVG